jgi:ABC-2 type transport system ATP-binding protein
MGLDPGYRRLFIDYLTEYTKDRDKTIFITSHIIQDLEGFVDDIVILDYKNVLLSSTIEDFKNNFKRFKFTLSDTKNLELSKDTVITNFEIIKNNIYIYSFSDLQNVREHLKSINISVKNLEEVPMNLEDAFIGLTGKY